MSMIIPFVGQSYKLDSLNIDAQKCQNWFPEANQQNSKSVLCLRPTPGLKLYATLNGGSYVRGVYTTSDDRFFAVCGNTLNEVDKFKTVYNRGTLTTSSGIVTMSNNSTQLIITDGKTGYILDLNTNVLTEIADTDYPGGSHVAFIDQYFIVNKPYTGQFQWSNLADGTIWDGADIATAEGNPDIINSLISMGRELWIFGRKSYEVFYNSGDTNRPFRRIEGTFNDVGCVAPASLARLNTNLFWVGSNSLGHGTIYMSNGYEPVQISTVAIEETIESYVDLSDAVGFCYSQNGHEFYQCSFPTGGTSWVYDLSTGMWHERVYTDSNGISYAHRAHVQDFFEGKNIVGDRLTGRLYEYDTNYFTDNTEAIHRVRSSPHIWNNLDRVFYSSFQLDMEVGVGLATGQGSDPQIMLDWSNDGGHTWSNEVWRSIGKMGEYKTRVKWNRLGSARDRVFRVRLTDPVKANIMGAVIT